MNGGYYMIDFSGLDLTGGSTPQTIAGIYNKCINAIGLDMAVYAINASWGDSPVTPIQVFIVPFDGYVIVTASTLQVIITNEDVITINNLAPEDGN